MPVAKATHFNVLDIPAALTLNSLLDAPFGDHASAREQTDAVLVPALEAFKEFLQKQMPD